MGRIFKRDPVHKQGVEIDSNFNLVMVFYIPKSTIAFIVSP